MMVKFVLCSQVIEIKDKGFHMLRCISETVAPSAVNVTYICKMDYIIDSSRECRLRQLGPGVVEE